MVEYCVEFYTIVLSLPHSHLEDLTHAFIYGLKPYLWSLVKYQVAQKEELTLPEAMTVEIQLEKYVQDNQLQKAVQ